jgi:glycine/D-amino acid oxidase-like deaminating enzyme
MSGKVSRRAVLQTSIVITAGALASPMKINASVVKKHYLVVGAGAFGGWTALQLLRLGGRVTLIDSWGPGNSRASSGGETRVIRATYGANRIYTKMAVRALQQWRENEKRWNRKLYTRTGALWMVIGSEEFETASMPLLKEAGLKCERLTTEEASRRFPQINFDGVNWALWEPEAGFLLSRQACEIVRDSFVHEGGEYRQAFVKPGKVLAGNLSEIVLSDGSQLSADAYVFACGPWLGKIFPGLLGDVIRPTRQEVFFFGMPPGDTRFNPENFPVWINHGAALFYGIPGNQYRGFKVADDTHGPEFDPTSGERAITQDALKAARELMELRFPGMKGAPLVESRVCQYENSPDSNFIVDQHPEAQNVWLVGGGSGHGYKHGPALGEYVAKAVRGELEPDPLFRLARFKK